MALLLHTKSFDELAYVIRKSTTSLTDHSEINHALNVYSNEVYQAGIKEGRKDKEIEDSKNYKERLHRSKNYIELLEFIDDRTGTGTYFDKIRKILDAYANEVHEAALNEAKNESWININDQKPNTGIFIEVKGNFSFVNEFAGDNNVIRNVKLIKHMENYYWDYDLSDQPSLRSADITQSVVTHWRYI